MRRRISPLPESARRRPGQSLEVRQQQILWRQAALISAMVFVLGLLIGNLWLPQTMETRLILIGALPSMLVAAIMLDRWLDRRWHAATLGREGEVHVGQALQELEACGARIVHDVIGPIGNIDHIVFHQSGIYAVETKTWSRDYKRLASLAFDGRRFRRNGRPVISDPVRQSIIAAKWLRTHLQSELGLNFKCRVEAVIVFPGWNVVVEREHPHARILSTADLVATIKSSEAKNLSPAQVDYFANMLEKSVS